MRMSALARSATDFPFRFAIPYSVTIYITSERGVVTMLPGVRFENYAATGLPCFR